VCVIGMGKWNVLDAQIANLTMTLNPKTRFQQQEDLAKRHLDVTASESFLRAAESALLQLIMDMGTPKNNDEAAANWYAVAGAKKYMELLLNLAEKPVPPSRISTHNLDHAR